MEHVMKAYSRGKYDECLVSLKELQQTLQETCSLFAEEENVSEDENNDKDMWDCIYANDYLVCLGLKHLISSDNADYVELLREFRHMFEVNSAVPSYPLQLRLNLLYNYLYWYWIKFSTLPKELQITPQNCFNSYLCTVLRECEDTYIEHELDDWDELEKHIQLLTRLLNLILKRKSLESVQIVDIIHVLLLILAQSCEETVIERCNELCQNIVSSVQLIQLHLQLPKRPKVASTEVGYFRFGFKHINTQLDLSHGEISLQALLLTVVLFYIKQRLYSEAMSVLEADVFDGTHFKFLLSYLKVYVHYQLEEYLRCIYIIQSCLSGGCVDEHSKMRTLILNGLALSKLGRHSEAVALFDKVVTSLNYGKSTALYYIACENKAMELCSSQLVCLQRLVETVRSESNNLSNTSKKVELSYELTCLRDLHPEPEITLYDALYISANNNLRSKHYSIAASTYNELLSLMLEADDFRALSGSLIELPDVRFIYHEAVLSNYKRHSYDKAEELAKTVIQFYIPHYTDSMVILPNGVVSRKRLRDVPRKHWTRCLYHFEQDVIALLLLSDVYNKKGDTQKQMEAINKCYNTVLEYLDHMSSPAYKRNRPSKQSESATDENLLCKMLMAKILLRKANLSIKLSTSEETEKLFLKAVSFYPGDEDVVYYYRKWLFSVNRQEEASKIVHGAANNPLNFEEHADYTVQYILQPMSEEGAENGEKKSSENGDMECDIFIESDTDETLLAELYD